MSGFSYSGTIVSFLTRHGKEKVVSPVLEAKLGCRIHHTDAYDTDFLGTFSRDLKRVGSQIEAARSKARIGMQLTGLKHGIASEGAFGPDPFAGLFQWNVEMLVLIDEENGLELTGIAQRPAKFDHHSCRSWAEAEAFAVRAGFPDHHLVVRPGHQDDGRIAKGISDWDAFESCFDKALRDSGNGIVFIENDLRAHANPERMETIRLAADDLCRKMLSLCPACGTPGFWLAERVKGLPCADCGLPTRRAKAEIWKCPGCSHHEQRKLNPDSADPQHCDRCNP
jgi:hypothetical protein